MRKIYNWKLFFYGILIFSLVMDIFGEGIMMIGVLLGWLIGMMTITQWNIERDALVDDGVKGK